MEHLNLESAAALSPSRVWKYFFEISQIPRESGDEKRVRQYVKQFAHKHDLTYKIDEAGNIAVKKPASKGKEKTPGIILQGHLDMVCVKTPESNHDFTTDPIVLVRDGDWVKARDTTLGADNGIAVAMALAVLEDEESEFGPVEALFTATEETGLEGAFGLDISMLSGRMLINLDSEDEGVFYVGSAGGGEIVAALAPEREMTDGHCLDWIPWEARVSGLSGGHSGGEIHIGKANAIKECTRFLKAVSRETEIRISSMQGGSKRNVIPSDCTVVFLIPPGNDDVVPNTAELTRVSFAERYTSTDPEGKLDVRSIDMPGSVLTASQSKKLINSLYITPHGVDRMSTSVPGIVETSTNLASISTDNNDISIVTSQRSAIESAREDISGRVAAALETSGAETRLVNTYPAWTPNPKSSLPKHLSKVYMKVTGKKPSITAIHAGLECGVLNSKAPDMESISMGPDIRNAHSTAEQVCISSVDRVYTFLLALLTSF